MENRRFDDLTVALARGGSRRGVLRGLAAGVLGALALDRSGAFAKNEDKEKKDKDGITLFAKPQCGTDTKADCPLCAAARQDATCCDQKRLAKGNEDACGTKATDRNGNSLRLNCTTANDTKCSTSCVNATCVARTNSDGSVASYRCTYLEKDPVTNEDESVTKACPGMDVCCNDYTSKNFGSCVANRNSCN
jgi:hypothetical protein